MGFFGKKTPSAWRRRWTEEGIILDHGNTGKELGNPLLPTFIEQLVDDGLASEYRDGFIIFWDSLYEALSKDGYEALPDILALPPFTKRHPTLASQNTLTDADFSIFLAGWAGNGGVHHYERYGAVLRGHDDEELMRGEHWRLAREVFTFARRQEHGELFHRQAWGIIRKLALAAGADLDNFLSSTIVLTPDKLRLGLHKIEEAGETDVEIAPTFENAPPGWLAKFDALNNAKDRYDLPTKDGIIQVLIAPQVKSVLAEIKRLPKRRARGARAKAILLNPVAALGEDAGEVIDLDRLEQEREQVGLFCERFQPLIERDVKGNPTRVGLRIETLVNNGVSPSTTEWLIDEEGDHALDDFVRQLEAALAAKFPLLGWQGYEFELTGEAGDYLRDLRNALAECARPRVRLTWEEVHNLDNYSLRIEGIGEEKPYCSIYIEKEGKKDWFPGPIDILIGIPLHPPYEPKTIKATSKQIVELHEAIQQAKASGKTMVSHSILPGSSFPIDVLEPLIEPFIHKNGGDTKPEQEPPQPPEKDNGPDGPSTDKPGGKNTGDSPLQDPNPPGPKPEKTKSLILKPNIEKIDYEELRREIFKRALLSRSELPISMKKEISLLEHQQVGLAWLQGMYKARQSVGIHGLILADDMGLGKTLQILAFIAWLLEQDTKVEPMLVVAPVSLLENWREEIEKFFRPGTLPILTAYGDTLHTLRLPRAEIDQQLVANGLVRFLKPDWLGASKIVLTTYETLRNLEFSFAMQPWSVMVCDEAQKIKNPAAGVTRAAKKQNAAFKIACTGTPVENTLADLWCLFDFIQPGLLGSLDEFGKYYCKPIEAKTDEDKARVEELRGLIEPQVLRRTKAEVAKDLKQKISEENCRKLPLSKAQRELYARAIQSFQGRGNPGYSGPFKNHLSLLHYLRLICTDPKKHGLTSFTAEPLAEYRRKAPKLDWLLERLAFIRQQKEKAIIFCEFREIQRLLQFYINEAFHLSPPIINGETSASAASASSRQKQIKAFQQQTGFGVLILSPLAVGFGVNIQAANHVIHYMRHWNPAKEDQATDRAYRIGQQKDVFVYYPTVCADDFVTFDVRLNELLEEKRSLAGDMLNGTGEIDFGGFDDGIAPPGSGPVDERVTLEIILAMQGRYFEALAATIWSKRGFTCVLTPQAGDHGVDVVAIQGKSGILIQVKKAAEGRELGWDAVKEVVAGEAFYRRQYPGIAFTKIAMTNQSFNDRAREDAKDNGVELLEQAWLEESLNGLSIMMSELERILFND